jgi:single-stranded-DNA-specific exonuclease
VTPELLRDLSRMAPFGPGNREPLFWARDLQVVGEPRIVGASHLKFKLRKDKVVLSGIAFDAGDRLGELATGLAGLSVACALEEDEWQGKKEIRLRVKDFKTR